MFCSKAASQNKLKLSIGQFKSNHQKQSLTKAKRSKGTTNKNSTSKICLLLIKKCQDPQAATQ